MQAPSAPVIGVRDEALKVFDAALADLPRDEARTVFLRAGGYLRILGDTAAGAPVLSDASPAIRLRALAYAAAARRESHSLWRGTPPTAALVVAVRAALGDAKGAESSAHEAALALWIGGAQTRQQAGADADSERARAALELAIGWGVPSDPRAANLLAEQRLGAGTVAVDTVRVAIVRAHLDGRDAALAVVMEIAIAAARLEALFELTLAAALAGDAELLPRLRAAAEATYVLAAEDELWPHAADIQIAGIIAATGGPPALAASALGTATRKLEGVLPPDARVRIYRLALLAAPHVGIAPWRALLEQFLADRQLLRSPTERAHLMFEVAGSAAHFADPQVRTEALARVADLLGRMPDLALRGLVCAELARLLSQLPGRSPATWVAECKKTLATRPATAPFLGKTLRLLGEADPAAALAIVAKLPRPEERALGAMLVGEVAVGIRER